MAGSSSNNEFPMNTLMHMIHIKLCSTNYLLWKNQMEPILNYQHLMSYVDGSSTAPPTTLPADGKTVENPAYTVWLTADQRTIILLHASLSEEAVTVIIGLLTARAIWVELETAYANPSIERAHNLRDKLSSLQKGSQSVAEFGRTFKNLSDQLAAIAQPASDHMTATPHTLNNPAPVMGNESVTFGNGNTLPITHKGHLTLNNTLHLNNVLVVPNITKNLLSISKLTHDNSVDVILSHPFFSI
ncbi:hypothetical protein E3N88_19261 [Mikania micrantha]|uniref:Retrovirus-related Pol polyprotein from transposon TNT 1-94-like beta-barrel domain-containing protein n=1 Tax=Mikania micrantha TaxID=192012 RepID=A0A5N6NQ24_9ASTR|nr:hypothetical protein E3N88_19261 [Mikania micrantha]